MVITLGGRSLKRAFLDNKPVFTNVSVFTITHYETQFLRILDQSLTPLPHLFAKQRTFDPPLGLK
jgi:hypothetical protein